MFQRWLAVAGLPLAGMTAVYTAYLFAQAKARDLWQNPLLPPHFLVQAVLAGSGALALTAWAVSPDAVVPIAWTFAGATALHLLLVAGEVTLPHGTAHAHLAVREMTHGRYSAWFRAGVELAALALLAPLTAVWGLDLAVGITVVAGLAGLFAFEHAYVQAGQSVPLA